MSIPRDEAGNPLDPAFNTAVFTGSAPLTARSIFTDRGPIARPPLTIQSGLGGTITGPDTITLTGAVLNTVAHLGLLLTVSGTTVNQGTFRIGAILSPTQVRVSANFHLPDASNGALTWTVFDPRDGQVADEPGEVTVTVNGAPVVPEAVVGLLGQVVLPTEPSPSDNVKVSYRWVDNPTVEIRRLNSREFRLNGWNRDLGHRSRSKHTYRYNNVLVRPSDYTSSDVRARLSQPKQRDLKYRAYERAYTPVLNDPTSLKLNSPIHRIAFAPLSRTNSSTFVSYTATALPESDPDNPWKRHGTGSAVVQTGSVLVVEDTTTGPFPDGQPVFWTRTIDLMFEHVFAASWRTTITMTPLSQGVFTGVAAGYSDGQRVVVVGYLDDNGVKKIGFLKAGAGNDPSLISGWAGGFDLSGNPTGAPVEFDWSVVHSYRLFRDRDANLKLFVDGDVQETLRLEQSSMPYLGELDAPFETLEGVFFGSLSRPAQNTSHWEFFRYSILPTNPLQTEPSVFVSYEGVGLPETAAHPWTPVGFAGTETTINGTSLLLDSTSATSSTQTLVGGSFKGYTRIEPLLSVSSDVVLDINVQLRTHTHGVSPNSVMAAIDDGSRLVQLSFFPDKASPKISYGGHSFPEVFTPTSWSTMGTQPVEMVGRYLRITDSSTTDGRIYFYNDNTSVASERVVSQSTDYILEARAKVLSYIADSQGFCGVTAEVYDGLRALGLQLIESAGVRYVALHSDGVVNTQFAFEWDDGQAHTYRLVKSTSGNLVSLFVDSTLLGTAAYSSFAAPGAGTTGVVSFGSSTATSMQARSTVEWTYANAWRVLPSLKRYVGIWKGTDSDSLVGYHLPLKARSTSAEVSGSSLTDSLVDFVAAGVQAGDYIVIDVGSNKGTYAILSVGQHSLTVAGSFPVGPSTASYRIPSEVDWTTAHRYRVIRDPGGSVSVLLDEEATPIIRIGYNEVDLPKSMVGVPRVLSGALPSISFGAFDPTSLSQSAWDFVRYGITRSPTELRIAPHHPFLNQRNVIASPAHLTTTIAHSHTDFWSSSTGIPPQIAPDFMQDPNLIAFTLLNERTPLVPQTQAFEVRRPQVVREPVSALNRPEDVLNNDGDFVLNDGQTRLSLQVPNDVLYSSLQVLETSNGVENLIAPFEDGHPQLGPLRFQGKHCFSYDGTVLPELDSTASTPWSVASDDESHVSASVFAGVLTYGTDGTGTKTIYRNATPLPDSIGLTTQVKFRLRLLNDASGGTGDSQVRFGFSAPGLTLALAFVTSPLGERYVLAIDQVTKMVVGGQRFDFLDGNFHDYRLVRDPAAGEVRIFIDS